MSGVGEASALLGLITSSITMIQAAQVVYDAVDDVRGLPRTFRVAADRIPLAHRILSLAESNVQSLDEQALLSVKPVLEACKERASSIKNIFDQSFPSKDASRTKRLQKAIILMRKSKNVKEDMEELFISLELLSQHRVFEDGEALISIQEAIEELGSIDQEEQSHFLNTGPGTIYANTAGGTMRNYTYSGRGNSYVAESQIFHSGQVTITREEFCFRKAAGICLGQAPYIDPTLFVGRKSELEQMEQILRPDSQTPLLRRLTLAGMAGIGKTQLAIEYTNRHRNDYESAFWLDATSQATVEADFQRIIRSIYHSSEAQNLSREQAVVHMHRWLSDPQNIQWLLIFDNYDDPDLFKLQQYYPVASHGTIIVTTRRLDRILGEKVLVKPLLNVQDSLEILATRSEREDTKQDPFAMALAERFKGLPLALATAGAYLQQSHLSFQDYHRQYEERYVVDPYGSLELEEYQNRTLYTTWSLSYERLQRKFSPAAKFLQLLAYFNNEDIQYKHFHAGDPDKLEWLREIVNSEVHFDSIMGKLTNYCFTEGQRSAQTWSMHNCVHDWTLRVLNDKVDLPRYQYALSCVVSSIDSSDSDWLQGVLYSPLAAHAARLVHSQFWQDSLVHETSCDRFYSDLYNIATLLQSHDRFSAAEEMYIRALAGYETALGPEDTSTLNATNGLGGFYTRQGELKKAEQMFNRALAGYRKAPGINTSSTLGIVVNLGNLYRRQGKLVEAEQLLTPALAECERALRPDHEWTLNAVYNLGILYDEQGKLVEAEQMHLRALDRKEKALGLEHFLTLDTVNSLGNFYTKQGKLTDAEQMYTRALAGREKVLGSGHTSTLNTFSSLGSLYAKQGKLTDAEQMYTRALAGYEKALGTEHTSTLDMVSSLGILYARQGKLAEAEQMYLRVLTWWETAPEADHSSTLGMVSSLGILYANQGKLVEAEQVWIRALARLETFLRPDHTSTLNIVGSLGIFYAKQGRLAEAERMYTRALTGYEQAPKPDHGSTLGIVNNLGQVYARQDKLVEAEQMYTRALAGWEKAFGAEHRWTLMAVNNLGRLYARQGKVADAEQMYIRVLAGYEKAFGREHPSTQDVLHSLDHLHNSQSLLKQSESDALVDDLTQALSSFKISETSTEHPAT